MASEQSPATDADRGAPGWVSLTTGEQVLWTGRPSAYEIRRSLATFLGLFVLGVAGNVALPTGFRWLGLAVVGVGALVAAWAYVGLVSVRYVVTNRTVYKRTGLIRRTIETTPLGSVQTVSLSQSFGQRIVGCGDVRIETAASGVPPLVLEHARTPNDVVALVTDRIGPGGGDRRRPSRRSTHPVDDRSEGSRK